MDRSSRRCTQEAIETFEDQMSTNAQPDPRRWKALAVLGVAYLMVVLDVSIVNVALPSIQQDLDFAPEDLQWVVSAYALTFGGFLLLGGRAGDLLGRRALFMSGLFLFALFSLICGLAVSSGMLIAARALQGLAGAILSPSVFSITLVTFPEGAERNKALGILGAIAGSGAAIGVLLGGVLTEYVGWEWIFFVNVPIGLAALFFVPRLVKESRAEGLARHFDALGAVTVTASLMLLVYGLTQSNNVGWGSAQTIGVLVASAALMAAFLVTETRSRSPLLPLGIFRRRTLAGANMIGFGLGTMVFGMFFLLSLYMQQVLGFSAMETGVGYLAVALTVIVASGAAQALVTRLGVKPVLAVGMVLLGAGLILFTQVSADGSLCGRPAARLHPDRRRPRVLVRARLDRGARRRFRPRGRSRLRAHQHEPADWRRAGPRDPDDDLDDAHRESARGRRDPAAGPDGRLQPRVLGSGRLRRRVARDDAPSPAARRPPRRRAGAGRSAGALTRAPFGAAWNWGSSDLLGALGGASLL